MRVAANVLWLGIKELRSLLRDPIMLVLIVYACSYGVYSGATSMPETLYKAPIAIVDEDQSPLSARIAGAFYAPYFLPPQQVGLNEVDAGLDEGRFTFALDIPQNFQREVMAGRAPAIQLNIDATRMSQAFSGGGYVQQIVQAEVAEFVAGNRDTPEQPVELEVRARFNPTLSPAWFGSIMAMVNNITMLAIVLSGAALIREREHGTIDHLLVMPVTPFEIMASKIWAMGLVVLTGCAFALTVVVQAVLKVPIEGSVLLFLAGAMLHLFAATSIGIFLATMARSMPQFGLLLMLVLLPLQMLSGGSTPRESMPELVQNIMLIAPTTHFVAMAQAILYRGAGLEVVWPQFLALVAIGGLFCAVALARFRKTISAMA
ncbi:MULTISPECIES: ABC transporter permease [Sphingomonas]|uniref:ABC transporter permease n=1 Tax=Sphingomonas TaxID=13687 RepID=UPI000F7E73B2|nr:ABC transporter permease [Sphingomonas sp. ABOLF]RSV12336.1 ABC transporter permease [Sphingomonas sp. ABOLF]GLK20567.1 membrane protein [Microbacterium terregens]